MFDIDQIDQIRLSKSILNNDEKEAVLEVINNGYLGMGKYVQKFEYQLSQMMGRDVACVTNGTAALHLALQACDIGHEDEVLVQSITYLASFQAISATGAIPIPCDIDLNTLTIDLEDAKNKISKKTKAIMPVHYAGELGNYEDIYKFAVNNNLRVIEDAAHAFGTKRNNEYVGSFGDVVCFSFDGIKNITSGEGGCITSSDKKVLQRIKDIRLLGVRNDTKKRFEGKRTWECEVFEQGWRYHMSDIMAAIGLSQLKKLEIFSQKRQSLAEYYDSKLNTIKEVIILKKDYSEVVPHIYPIILKDNLNREDIQSYLKKHKIQTGIHYKPNHLLNFYQKDGEITLSNTEKIYKNIMSLPLHPDLDKTYIDYIVSRIKEYIKISTNNL